MSGYDPKAWAQERLEKARERARAERLAEIFKAHRAADPHCSCSAYLEHLDAQQQEAE